MISDENLELNTNMKKKKNHFLTQLRMESKPTNIVEWNLD